MAEEQLIFEQIHIDAARNSTDDFNPFHDPTRWQRIRRNPYPATIVLGFQMEFLAADRVGRLHRDSGHAAAIADRGLHFSNYDFHFADALCAGERFVLTLKKTVEGREDGALSNRVLLRKQNGELILMGTVSASREPRYLADQRPVDLPSLQHMPDRSHLPGTPYFMKRKFLNTSNGKNFALGALCDQHDYFDELADRVHFAPLFTVSLLSSALLEKGWTEQHDFEADPMVYAGHQISVDNRLQARLRSNDVVHLLIDGPTPVTSGHGLGGAALEQQRYRCFGILHGRDILFRADVNLVSLHSILDAAAKR